MFVNLFSSTLSYFSSCIFAIVIFHIAFLGLIIGFGVVSWMTGRFMGWDRMVLLSEFLRVFSYCFDSCTLSRPDILSYCCVITTAQSNSKD
jgi:hypothetical protein